MNSIVFERFTEEHIPHAVRLALTELEAERLHCPELPSGDHSGRLSGLLHWLCGQGLGRVALMNGEPVGYMLFAGPWEGFFGLVRGAFSPLGGSAFAHAEGIDRGRLASMLFADSAEMLVDKGVFSCAVSRCAHDEETARSFVLNGFGIRCSDAMRRLSSLSLPGYVGMVHMEELPFEDFHRVSQLQMGLVRHLAAAPTLYPTDMERFDRWFENREMRIFAAFDGEQLIGFISVKGEGENFVSESDSVINICGAYFDGQYRGKGIAQGLLSHVCAVMTAEGYTHIGVDCETMNPTALNFWGKYFTPYTYSYARRFDERIEGFRAWMSASE